MSPRRAGMPGPPVKLELTIPQARKMWLAATYLSEQDPAGDGLQARDLAVLLRGLERLDKAIDEAETWLWATDRWCCSTWTG